MHERDRGVVRRRRSGRVDAVPLPPPPARSFASDNFAGAHPAVVEAIARVNHGHAGAYGDDPWTKECEGRFRDLFGADVTTLLTFNGTGSNIVALACLLRPAEAVVCTDWAHIAVDETGGPERILGAKLIDLPAPDAKLTPGPRRGPGPPHRQPAPRPAGRRVDHPEHRARHALHRRRGGRRVRGRPPPRDDRPHGRRAHRQRHGRARRRRGDAAGDDGRRRGRRAVVRRDQERPRRRRGGRLPAPRAGARARRSCASR